jgi:ribose 5-phosphate isomerase B
MKILIASDHAGLELKNKVIAALKNENKIIDLGPNSTESVDYPDYANKLCLELKKNLNSESNALSEFGILICGSGQGMSMRANKFLNVRAALVYNDEMAVLSREHNDANVICLGSRFCSPDQALKWINLFKITTFAGGRHQTRVAKVSSPIS